jgi:hypothetical protein
MTQVTTKNNLFNVHGRIVEVYEFKNAINKHGEKFTVQNITVEYEAMQMPTPKRLTLAVYDYAPLTVDDYVAISFFVELAKIPDKRVNHIKAYSLVRLYEAP